MINNWILLILLAPNPHVNTILLTFKKKKKKKQTNKQTNWQRIYIFWPRISILCPDDLKFGIWLQILNKEHEKAEDSKPVAVPATTGS